MAYVQPVSHDSLFLETPTVAGISTKSTLERNMSVKQHVSMMS